MIRIDQSDFNKEMDDYIDGRSGERKKISFFKKKKKTAFPPKGQDFFDEHQQRKKKVSFLSSLFRKRIPSDEEIEEHMAKKLDKKEREELENIEEDLKDANELEDEIEEVEESLITKFLKKLRIYSRKEEEFDEELEIEETASTEEELKETLKILHKWLEQLPPDKKEAFKRSEDFHKYKEALRKLGMIKE